VLRGERVALSAHPLPVIGLTGAVAEMNTGTAVR
jgi:hypothetical protein